jgi:hypothetical protein
MVSDPIRKDVNLIIFFHFFAEVSASWLFKLELEKKDISKTTKAEV